MGIYLKQLSLGPMQNYVYLVGDPQTKQAAVVDPAWNVPVILQEAQADGYRITHALLSHGHYDHINGVEELVEKTDAIVCAEKNELEEFIYEGAGGMVIPRTSLKKTSVAEAVRVGKLDIQMIHTPGHTPGCRCMLIRPDTGGPAEALMTGDTLFVGTIGRCDFPYSSPRDQFQSLAKLKKLPDETVFYPGHDYGSAPSNSIGKEKKTNPYMMARDVEEFLQMVRR
jgi:glyoxylase-like metal-dependent hydrolase (beta-lactamase superfamily II)